MIVNIDELNEKEKLSCDVCVVGAGPAGITLSKKIADKGYKVILCEGGSKEYTEDSQNCYKGSVEGDYYFQLDYSRLRYFGGSSNHWGGWCRYFEEVDFDRSYLDPEFKWPINKKDIDLYLEEACSILEIEKKFDEKIYKNSDIKKISFNISDVNFGEKYFNFIKESKNIKLILNSNLIDINLNNKRTESLIFSSFQKKKIEVAAKTFVLSMGGIENSRILLWFYEKYKDNLCNKEIPIGKYWMEHPHFTIADAVVNKEVLKAKHFSILKDAQINEKILGCSFTIDEHNYEVSKKLLADLLCVAPKLGEKMLDSFNKKLVCGVKLYSAWEQSPDKNNQINLSKIEFDKFGIPRTILKWKKKELDRKTIEKSFNILDNWLKNSNLGRFRVEQWIGNKEKYPEDDMIAGHHHMGGTRMGNDLNNSVVDKNCKLHGNHNIYICGSSVFRTGGYNNPTLPIIQLSLRLANYINEELKLA